MSRFLSVLAAAALSAALAEPVVAAPAIASDDAPALGVLQQGKGQGGGQGGGQETRGGGRGQGGGSEARGGGRSQGGGGQDRQEARGNRGGGSSGGSARQSGQEKGQGQSARGSGSGNSRSSGGNSGSARSDERGSGRSSGGEARATERGNSGNASARSETRGNSGNAAASSASGNSGRGNSAVTSGSTARARHRLGDNDLRARIAALPEPQRRMAASPRVVERMTAGAIARAHARGLPANAFDVRSDDGRVRVLNRRGDLLWDMDERRAGELGSWRLRRMGDQSPRANAPAFCRSGEGHPVWGREWCIDKGFGLGSRSGTIWSRGGIGDVIFRQPDYRTRLDRGGLAGVLGDIIFGRLALQSVALGYDEPLTGYWVADPAGPYILRVRSGDNDVAEFYDRDRDNRVEVLYVVQPVW